MSGKTQQYRKNGKLEGQDHDRQSDLAVMDANEYKQKRRLQRILDAHDQVEDIDRDSMSAIVEGSIKWDGREVILLRAVQQFIRECYNMLRSHVQDQNGEYDKYWTGNPDAPLGKIEMEHEEDVVFYGLGDVLHADRFYHESWEETVETRHGPAQTEEFEERYTVPEEVSMNAFLRLKAFLEDEQDLDLSFEANEVDADAAPY